MFSVIFEVHPDPARWDDYIGTAAMLRPEIERIEGFVDNIRYRSLTRPGWVLSLSNWRHEKSLVRWRTRAGHHQAQEKGRAEILLDYHLRVGQITADTRLPAGSALVEQRLDETEAGTATTIVLVDGRSEAPPTEAARHLGLPEQGPGLVGWDIFEAILTPGDLILLTSWRSSADADGYRPALPADARRRQIRVVRDYGMFDRHEAPQYYPDVPRR